MLICQLGEYVEFKKLWEKSHGKVEVDSIEEKVIIEQFKLIDSGITDSRIHDNTFLIWEDLGHSIY